MSGKRILTISADQARELLESGKSGTDVSRVRNQTEAELEQAIASDPDWQDIPRDWWREAEFVVPPVKVPVSIRLDPDILDWFKAKGPGYQTRINAALRAFIKAHA